MSRTARKGQNEVWFRELNERLEQRALVKHGSTEQFEVVCECDREECAERLAIGVTDYESVRATATDFIVAHGHVDPNCEQVVDSKPEYEVVEKRGEAAAIAEIEDPRS